MDETERWLVRRLTLVGGLEREWWVYDLPTQPRWGMKVLTFKAGHPPKPEQESRYGNAVALDRPITVAGLHVAEDLLETWLEEHELGLPLKGTDQELQMQCDG